MPPAHLREIQSSALDSPAPVDNKGAAFLDAPLPTDTRSAAFLDAPLPTDTAAKVPEDVLVAKRIKFTKMLLQYQGDLQGLEAQKIGIDSVNPDLEEEIKTLTIKIQNLQNIISSLTQ